MKRIVCVGNRYHPEDVAGPRVYDYLRTIAWPPDVEVIDGGVAGLDLLRFVESAERVVFVDALAGPSAVERVVVLTADEVAANAPDAYDHAAGLPYLLRVLRRLSDDPVPEVFLVGIEGRPGRATIAAAGDLSLSLAASGRAAEPGQAALACGAVS